MPAEHGMDKSPFAIPEVGAEQAQVVTAAPGNRKGDEGGTPQVAGALVEMLLHHRRQGGVPSSSSEH